MIKRYCKIYSFYNRNTQNIKYGLILNIQNVLNTKNEIVIIIINYKFIKQKHSTHHHIQDKIKKIGG